MISSFRPFVLSSFRPALAIAGCALVFAAPTQEVAPPPLIDVVSYSGTNGGPTAYGYDDDSYSGTRSQSQLSGGEGDLSDGAKGMAVGIGYERWRPYVMWYLNSPVLTFDLGAQHDLVSVRGYFNFYPNAAVYIPPQARIRFSDDGVQFGASQVRTFDSAERTPGANDSTPDFEMLTAAGQGRYVELTLTTPGGWIALSEVEFRGRPSSVPEPGNWALMAAGLAALGGLARRRRA